MGADPWKFGIKGSEKVLETLIRYAGEQGLLAKKTTIADMFIPMDEPHASQVSQERTECFDEFSMNGNNFNDVKSRTVHSFVKLRTGSERRRRVNRAFSAI